MFIFPPAPSASNPPTRTQKPCSSVLISVNQRLMKMSIEFLLCVLSALREDMKKGHP
jgi:hypothetical protein